MDSYPEWWRERPDDTQQPALRQGANSVSKTGRCEGLNQIPFRLAIGDFY